MASIDGRDRNHENRKSAARNSARVRDDKNARGGAKDGRQNRNSCG
jgi:hypothetical protein